MRIAFVVSTMFGETSDFIHALAQSGDHTVIVLNGDDDVDEALRAIRFTDRVWFEGTGALMHELLNRETSRWITGAVLRAAEQDVSNLPSPKCWELVSDLIVPSREVADLVRRTHTPSSARVRIHIIEDNKEARLSGKAAPSVDLSQLDRVLTLPANDLPPETWECLVELADICGERVLILGDPLEEFVHYVEFCHGREVLREVEALAGRQLDTIVFWDALRPETAGQMLTQLLKLLSTDGTAAIVSSRGWTSEGLSRPAAMRLLEDSSIWDRDVELKVHGPVVLAMPPAGENEPPLGNDRRVEVTGEWPLISAAIPVYNDERHIGRALSSLRRQTYPNLEIVVVDDGSTDGTRHAIESHLIDPRVRYFYKQHSGWPETRNLGVEKSRGAYVAWLGSDDESLPNRIAAEVQAVRDNPAVDIVHTDGFPYDPNGRLGKTRRYKQISRNELPGLLLEGFAGVCPVLDTSAMIRRSLYERIGPYDLDFARCQDYDFYFRTAVAGDVTYHHVPAPLVKFCINPRDRNATQQELKSYCKLIRKLIDLYTPEQLLDCKARDLRESPALALARKLVDVAALYKAPPDHSLFADAQAHLERAVGSDQPTDRAGAMCVLGIIAWCANDGQAARTYYQNALQLVPGSREASEGLRFPQSRDEDVRELSNEAQPV